MVKAVVVTKFGGPEVLDYTTISDPTPGSGQILIQVNVTGVNFADILTRRGGHHIKRLPPFVPGLDLMGKILEVGPDVKSLKIGQRVVAFSANGSYAELAIAPEALTFPIPDSIDDETAASFPVAAGAAYHILAFIARLQKGERIIIHLASGGVGTAAIQLAKVSGASLVIGTVGSDFKSEMVKNLGADAVVNYQNESYLEKVKDLTNGKGVDVILNSIAGETIERDLKCLALFGRIVLCGHASGKPGRIFSDQIQASNRSVLGFSFGSIRRHRPELVAPTMDAIINLIEKTKLKMIVGKRFSLEAAKDAHLWMASRKNTGKILLKVQKRE